MIKRYYFIAAKRRDINNGWHYRHTTCNYISWKSDMNKVYADLLDHLCDKFKCHKSEIIITAFNRL